MKKKHQKITEEDDVLDVVVVVAEVYDIESLYVLATYSNDRK